jgi:hypothetical protein
VGHGDRPTQLKEQVDVIGDTADDGGLAIQAIRRPAENAQELFAPSVRQDRFTVLGGKNGVDIHLGERLGHAVISDGRKGRFRELGPRSATDARPWCGFYEPAHPSRSEGHIAAARDNYSGLDFGPKV